MSALSFEYTLYFMTTQLTTARRRIAKVSSCLLSSINWTAIRLPASLSTA